MKSHPKSLENRLQFSTLVVLKFSPLIHQVYSFVGEHVSGNIYVLPADFSKYQIQYVGYVYAWG